ncbi:MAG: hypothetical protein F4210_14830 [Holophagales bacterium]|nr:hypothetical protein [Holophagales bacterium]MYF96751.1 hypothetical protein [Holophagales bacterium]
MLQRFRNHWVRRRPRRHPAQSAGLRTLFVVAAFTLLVAPPAAAAECEPREAEGPVTVESCSIENADYPLVRAEMTVPGSMSAVIALLDDAAACSDWQAMCTEETATPLDAPFQTLRQRVSGKGITRRISMNSAAWWRTADGHVVGDMVGADDQTPAFKGKRVLCMRTRWFLSPGDEEGTVTVVQKSVSDPQPPFGMGARVVTPRTAKTLLETFTNMSARLATGQHGAGPAIESLPLLEAELPGVGEEFARCQAARK